MAEDALAAYGLDTLPEYGIIQFLWGQFLAGRGGWEVTEIGDEMREVELLKSELLEAIEQASDTEMLEAVRLDALGKKGRISEQLKQLGKLPAEERKAAGQIINAVKEEIAGAISDKQTVLAQAALDKRLAEETLDISLPSVRQEQGRTHPLSRTMM